MCLRDPSSSKMFRHEKKGVVVQRERRRVGASWGDTKTGVARVTGNKSSNPEVPWSFPIFFWFLFSHTKRTSPTPPPHLVESSKQQSDGEVPHSSFCRPVRILKTSTLSHDPSCSPPLPSFPPLHSFWDIQPPTKVHQPYLAGSSFIAAANN